MSVREILEELPRLDASERQTVLRHLIEIDPALEVEETPEMLAAIDEAVDSFDPDKGVGIEEARRRGAQWTSK
jgi:7,8-dihydro-6-hydroxymethylpterin-pyrophosphokinase